VVLKVFLNAFLWAWFIAGFIALNTHSESRASGPCSIQVSYTIKLEEVLRIPQITLPQIIFGLVILSSFASILAS
jgi:hypothetical protein